MSTAISANHLEFMSSQGHLNASYRVSALGPVKLVLHCALMKYLSPVTCRGRGRRSRRRRLKHVSESLNWLMAARMRLLKSTHTHTYTHTHVCVRACLALFQRAMAAHQGVKSIPAEGRGVYVCCVCVCINYAIVRHKAVGWNCLCASSSSKCKTKCAKVICIHILGYLFSIIGTRWRWP